MAIRLPSPKTDEGSVCAPNTPVGRVRKTAHLRGFPRFSLGQCCPPHCPPRPEPFPGQQLPSPGPPKPTLGPPLDIRGVAKLIGCSPWTVRQTLIPRGLPHFRFKASGRLNFYQDQVVRWIENQQQGGKK